VTIGASLLLVLLAVAGWESLVRAGALPPAGVIDSPELWARHRERASTLGDDAIVLVGASRMQMGIDQAVLAERTGKVPVQLSITSSPFMPVLEHLAADESVTGTVVVSFHPANFLMDPAESPASRWLEEYDRTHGGAASVFYQPVENRLRSGLWRALESLGEGRRPQQVLLGSGTADYIETLPDRTQRADYSKIDAGLAYQRRLDVWLARGDVALDEVADLDERIDRLAAAVDRLRSRGARVAFVRFPSSRRIKEIDDIRHPRDAIWDRVAGRVDATFIHAHDYPTLSGFNLPDGVHIDTADQATFTAALADILVDSGDTTAAE